VCTTVLAGLEHGESDSFRVARVAGVFFKGCCCRILAFLLLLTSCRCGTCIPTPRGKTGHRANSTYSLITHPACSRDGDGDDTRKTHFLGSSGSRIVTLFFVDPSACHWINTFSHLLKPFSLRPGLEGIQWNLSCLALLAPKFLRQALVVTLLSN